MLKHSNIKQKSQKVPIRLPAAIRAVIIAEIVAVEMTNIAANRAPR